MAGCRGLVVYMIMKHEYMHIVCVCGENILQSMCMQVMLGQRKTRQINLLSRSAR